MTAWAVVDELGMAFGGVVEVDVQVGSHPHRDASAAAEAEDPGGLGGHAVDRLAGGVERGVADPVGEHERGPSRVHDLADVGAGVAEGREDELAAERGLEGFETRVGSCRGLDRVYGECPEGCRNEGTDDLEELHSRDRVASLPLSPGLVQGRSVNRVGEA
ncbi:MAG: hypothetical protein WKF43_10900 [Acidimicrobiales bacterium]